MKALGIGLAAAVGAKVIQSFGQLATALADNAERAEHFRVIDGGSND